MEAQRQVECGQQHVGRDVAVEYIEGQQRDHMAQDVDGDIHGRHARCPAKLRRSIELRLRYAGVLAHRRAPLSKFYRAVASEPFD